MTKTDNVVWTDFLVNPGDGQCPVPKFAVSFVAKRFDDVIIEGGDRMWEYDGELHGICIREYRYAIPEDLAWMAANVEAWPVPERVKLSKAWFCGGVPQQYWGKDQWLRARQDLGYAKSSKANTKHTQSINTEKHSVDQCRLEMLNSLYTAILKAGGDPRSIIDMDMTLESMVATLAQNGVRFCYDKQGKPE